MPAEAVKQALDPAQTPLAAAELAELLELTRDSIIVRDLDSNVVFWNRGAELRYGHKSSEALGKNSHDLLRTVFPVSAEATHRELLEKGHWEGELVHSRADGSFIVVASRQVMKRDAAGSPVAILEINHDITEQKQAQAILRRALDELESMVSRRTAELQRANAALNQQIKEQQRTEQKLLETQSWFQLAEQAANCGAWDWNVATGELRVSDGYYTMCGLQPGVTGEHAWRTALHPDDRRSTEQSAAAIFQQHKKDLLQEFRIVRPDGTVRWVLSRGDVTYDALGRPSRAVGVLIDITDRRQAEERIVRQQQIIGELSTPVLRVSGQLLIVPLVGSVDAQRAEQFTRQLLASVRSNRAKAVVVDITGVPSVDAAVASHLVQTAEAVRLLGANMVLTGISQRVAQALVELDVDVRKLATTGDLQSGIEQALRRIEQTPKR